MFTIKISVPNPEYLLPLERAIKDYSKSRKDSPDSLIRHWAEVTMPETLAQVESQRKETV